MTSEGARGITAEEVQNVFHFPTDQNERRSAFAALYNHINEPSTAYELSTANALWVQQEYVLRDEYIDTLKRYYVGEAQNVHFRNAPQEAALKINTWAAENTQGKIPTLLEPNVLTENTRLVLTNAIYFKGQWEYAFDAKSTKEENFILNSGDAVQAPLMQQRNNAALFPYAETDELQILEMPYKGDRLSMMVLLPKDQNALESLERSLTIEQLDEWRKAVKKQRVDIWMPKFSFNTHYRLNETLKNLGMPTAFTEGSADFSGIDTTQELYIQFVVHKAMIDVNEKGTEAAAATGVGGGGITSAPPPAPLFRADHPFLFFIQDQETGILLFFGRMEDPTI